MSKPVGNATKFRQMIKNKAKRKSKQKAEDVNPYFSYMHAQIGKQTKSMRRYRRSVKARNFREHLKG